ncbi:hypothetical protein ERO13_D07G194000v2 [Gossypium hirsutum]|uniref:Uncharacterized protein n=1 Tax=Gossypium hirsutum TaxID=3635 RepID=A0A1U8P4W3_GOSHI|nr:uncharacterized protein LOC107955059 [Gossypium hirsutum]KAG4139453.1 hypothetical protein ERO13_D07G194000v2 [Gossypium hirsutum]
MPLFQYSKTNSESSVLLPFCFSGFHLPCFTLPSRKAPPPSPSQHQTESPLTFSFLLLFLKVTAKKIGGPATQVHRFRAGTRASRDSKIPASSEKSQDFLDLHPFWNFGFDGKLVVNYACSMAWG